MQQIGLGRVIEQANTARRQSRMLTLANVATALVVTLAALIAVVPMAFHQIDEGFVGIYYRVRSHHPRFAGRMMRFPAVVCGMCDESTCLQ